MILSLSFLSLTVYLFLQVDTPATSGVENLCVHAVDRTCLEKGNITLCYLVYGTHQEQDEYKIDCTYTSTKRTIDDKSSVFNITFAKVDFQGRL